jgi:hypothetical protein
MMIEPGDSVLHGVNLTPRHGQEALESLERVSERLHALRDPRAAFPEVYGVITRRVLIEAREPRSRFLEPGWIGRLMGRFCARYLETLAWSLRGLPQDCAGWRLAYACADTGLTIPLQDVMLGISAHINYDLALGISQTIIEHGHADDPHMLARYKHDHDLVNELLRASIPESMTRLRVRHGCRASGLAWRTAPSLVEHVIMAVLGRWREHVWGDVLRLLAASHAGERRAVLRAMDRRSGHIARVLAGPSAGLRLGRAALRRLGDAPPPSFREAA